MTSGENEDVAFRGDLLYLSNYYPSPICMDGAFCWKGLPLSETFPMFTFDSAIYPASEHLYQALKSHNTTWHKIAQKTNKPNTIKQKSRKRLFAHETLPPEARTHEDGRIFHEGRELFLIREDWEEDRSRIRIKAMELALILKFTSHPELKTHLATQSGHLEEKNTWHDTFWGTCQGEGLNHLGKLLMQLREQLREDLKREERT